jgi:hypothetical protein
VDERCIEQPPGAACPDGFTGTPAEIIAEGEGVNFFVEVNTVIGCEVIGFLAFDRPIVGVPSRLEFVDTRYVVSGPGGLGFRAVPDIEEIVFPDLVGAESAMFAEMEELTTVRFPSLIGRILDEDLQRGISFDGGGTTQAFLDLIDLPSLTTLEAPSIEVLDILYIQNTGLTSLDLPSLRQLQELRIENNPSLSSCDVADLVEQLSPRPSNIVVNGLADTDCFDRIGVDPCADGGLIYENNVFNQPPPQCFPQLIVRGTNSDEIEISGIETINQLWIELLSANVRSVTFPDLTEIRGAADFLSYFSNNPGLERVSFPALTSFDGDLFLENNPRFIEFDAPLLECMSGTLDFRDTATGGAVCDPAAVGFPPQSSFTCRGSVTNGGCAAPPAADCVDSLIITNGEIECLNDGTSTPCEVPECVSDTVNVTGEPPLGLPEFNLGNLAFVGEAIVVEGASGLSVGLDDLIRVGFVGRDTPSASTNVEVTIRNNAALEQVSFGGTGGLHIRGDLRFENNDGLRMIDLPPIVEGDIVLEENPFVEFLFAPANLQVGGSIIVGPNAASFPICSLEDLSPGGFANAISFVSNDPECPPVEIP